MGFVLSWRWRKMALVLYVILGMDYFGSLHD